MHMLTTNRKRRGLYRRATTILLLYLVSLLRLVTPSVAQEDKLPEGATVSVLGRTAQVRSDGSFTISSVPADLGRFRVRLVAPDGRTAESDCLTPVLDGTTLVPSLAFDTLTPIPASLTLESPVNSVTEQGQTAQLKVTGNYPDGTTQNLTTNPCTTYFSSNPLYASVDENGLVVFRRLPFFPATLIITAMNDGVVGTFSFDLRPVLVPPTCEITRPTSGSTFLSGETILVHVDATSTIGIGYVELLVNGELKSRHVLPPYDFQLTLPAGSYLLGATAHDFGTQTANATPVAITVLPDQGTTVIGRVVDEQRTPLSGARVNVLGLAGTTGGDGRFSIPGVPTVQPTLVAHATYTLPDGKVLSGSSAPTALIPGGVTDVGDIMVIQRRETWTKFRGDARNTGRGKGGGATGVTKWEFTAGDQVFLSSPVISLDGTVYVASTDATSQESKLYALDGETGAKKWEAVLGIASISSPAVGVDGTVYIAAEDNSFSVKLLALDGGTGTRKWEVDNVYPIAGSPAIGADGTIYIGSLDIASFGIKLLALDGATGAKLWEAISVSLVTGCPAIGSDGTVYSGSVGGTLFALNGETGAKKWEVQVGSSISSSPAIGDDGTIYLHVADGIGNSSIVAVNGTTGAKKWEVITGNVSLGASPAIGTDGTVYIGGLSTNADSTFTGTFLALDGVTGATKWEIADLFALGSPAIGADGTIYISSLDIASSDRKFLALDGATGAKKWEIPLEIFGGEPAISADGTIYTGSSFDGKVRAIQ